MNFAIANSVAQIYGATHLYAKLHTLNLLQSNSEPANIIIVCNEYFGDAILSLQTIQSFWTLHFVSFYFFFLFAHYCFSLIIFVGWFLFVDSLEQRLMIDRCQTFENKKPVNIKKKIPIYYAIGLYPQ